MAWLNGPNNTLADIAGAVAAGLPFLDEITVQSATTTVAPASVSANFSQLYMDILGDIKADLNSSLQDRIACGHKTEVSIMIF